MQDRANILVAAEMMQKTGKCSHKKEQPSTASIQPAHRISRRQRFVRILYQIKGSSVRALGVGESGIVGIAEPWS